MESEKSTIVRYTHRFNDDICSQSVEKNQLRNMKKNVCTYLEIHNNPRTICFWTCSAASDIASLFLFTFQPATRKNGITIFEKYFRRFTL